MKHPKRHRRLTMCEFITRHHIATGRTKVISRAPIEGFPVRLVIEHEGRDASIQLAPEDLAELDEIILAGVRALNQTRKA